jgi:Trp operon repressor
MLKENAVIDGGASESPGTVVGSVSAEGRKDIIRALRDRLGKGGVSGRFNPLPALSPMGYELLIDSLYESSRANTRMIFSKALKNGNDLEFTDRDSKAERNYAANKFKVHLHKSLCILEAREMMSKKEVSKKYIECITDIMKRKPVPRNIEILIDLKLKTKSQKEISAEYDVSQSNISRLLNAFESVEKRVSDIKAFCASDKPVKKTKDVVVSEDDVVA